MLDIEIFKSERNNQWLIHQFEAYRFKGDFMTDKFLPRPYISLVFHFKDTPLIAENPLLPLQAYFVGPIIPRAILLHFRGNMDTFTVTCKASVFSRLFELDFSPVLKKSIELPKVIFHPLWLNLAKINTTEERTIYFTYFIQSIQPTPYVPDAVDILYDKILEKSITHPLKDIMQECFASKSTLLRKFIKRTGVSPKTLARIVRFNYLWIKIREEQALDYQDLVFHGNYFDQSHFINDFKAIVGETPGCFFKRNLTIVKIFSGGTSGKKIN